MNSLLIVDETGSRLAQYAKDAAGAYATATEKALRSDVLIFTGWCSEARLGSLPADPATVAAFVDAVGELKAPATIRRYVSSISTFHRAAGVANPTETEVVKLALKRLNRAKGVAQQQARGLTRGDVDRMLAACPDSLQGLRNKALLALAYDTLARRSELVAFQVSDIELADDGSATVTIRRSKTDQDGEGQDRYVALDTLLHVQAWCSAAGIVDGALFRSVLKGKRLGGALPAGELPRLFQGMARAAGLSEAVVEQISGHSTRVGAAQDMVKAGLALPEVMQAGGWKSPVMVSRYTRKADAKHGAAAKLARLQERG